MLNTPNDYLLAPLRPQLLSGYEPWSTHLKTEPLTTVELPSTTNIMSAPTVKIGDDFLKIPRLSADSRNWVIYRERLTLSVAAQGLSGHLTGMKKKPTEPKDKEELDGMIIAANQKDVDAYNDAIGPWMLNEAIVLQQIVSTIPDSLYLKIKRKNTVCEAWNLLKKDFKSRSKMFVIDLRKRLQEQHCNHNENVSTHFDTMLTMREDLASLGEDIKE